MSCINVAIVVVAAAAAAVVVVVVVVQRLNYFYNPLQNILTQLH